MMFHRMIVFPCLLLQLLFVNAVTFNMSSTAFLFLDNILGLVGVIEPTVAPAAWSAYVNSSLTLINAAYAAKGNSTYPVVAHTYMAFDAGTLDISDRNALFLELAPLFTFGSNATQFAQGFGPRAGGMAIHKTRFSVMFGTRFESILYARDITTVVLSGMSTTGAVLSTAVDLADRDFAVYIVADAVIDTTPDITNNTLTYLSTRTTSISLADALSALA